MEREGVSRPKRRELRVLVVGAGIGGLGAARALRQRGFAADVVERVATSAQTGAGLFLPGNAVRALRALGLESALTARSVPIPRQRICDRHGRLLTQIDTAALWGSVGTPVALHRSDLRDLLLSHDGTVPVRTGAAVHAVSQQGPTVAVDFGDGTTGDYDLVVAADGIHSTVRDQLFGRGAVRPVGQVAWRFVTTCPVDVATWTVMLGREVSFLAVPIGGGRVYCYVDAPSRIAPPGRGPAGTPPLASLLSGFGDPVPALLDSLGPEVEILFHPIEEVVLDRYGLGSVVLIGDAAHASSPNMAEGAAMALEDGLVLAECLSVEPHIQRALAMFETRRRPRTRWVRAQTHRRDRTRSLPPTLRDFVLRRAGRRIFHHNYRPLLEPP